METKHQKILRILEERARTSVVGSCFATEEKLCSEFGVSRMTVNKVICALVEKGLLYRIPLKGTFVKEPPKKSRHLVYLIPCPDAMVLDSWEAAGTGSFTAEFSVRRGRTGSGWKLFPSLR